MSISFRLSPFSITSQQQQQRQQCFFISQSLQTLPRRRPTFSPLKKITNPIRAVVNGNNSDGSASLAQEKKPRWENVLSTAASLYPVYVCVGSVVACVKPSAFGWFVKAAPASYSAALGLIMLAMGITLELKDFLALFWQKPLSVRPNFLLSYIVFFLNLEWLILTLELDMIFYFIFSFFNLVLGSDPSGESEFWVLLSLLEF